MQHQNPRREAGVLFGASDARRRRCTPKLARCLTHPRPAHRLRKGCLNSPVRSRREGADDGKRANRLPGWLCARRGADSGCVAGACTGHEDAARQSAMDVVLRRLGVVGMARAGRGQRCRAVVAACAVRRRAADLSRATGVGSAGLQRLESVPRARGCVFPGGGLHLDRWLAGGHRAAPAARAPDALAAGHRQRAECADRRYPDPLHAVRRQRAVQRADRAGRLSGAVPAGGRVGRADGAGIAVAVRCCAPAHAGGHDRLWVCMDAMEPVLPGWRTGAGRPVQCQLQPGCADVRAGCAACPSRAGCPRRSLAGTHHGLFAAGGDVAGAAYVGDAVPLAGAWCRHRAPRGLCLLPAACWPSGSPPCARR